MINSSKLKTLYYFLFLVFLFGCREDVFQEIYGRPDWLAGKIYTQILEQPELTTFAKAIELTGYDKIIDVSGSYTVFAPSNEAFNTYFSKKPGYNSVEDMPVDELARIVKYLIVQNPWSKDQLMSLDIFGWIDTLDVTNNLPRGFKRETLFLPENKKVGVAYKGSGRNRRTAIVDTLISNFHRIVVADSRKYVPVFHQQYLDLNNLKKSDYEFYFDRPIDNPGDLYYAGAKIVGEEIFAENGFIYIIDKVVEPLGSAYEIVENSNGTNNYSDFFDLINTFSNFTYNQAKTFEQPGAAEGIQVDSLFNVSYPELIFDINNEKTTPPPGTFGLPQNVTIRYHHGLLAPDNGAFKNFENEYFNIPQGWSSIDEAPIHIKRIIAKSHMSGSSIYPSDFLNGFYNGEKDIVKLDQENIIEKQFGSNATFIGLNEVVVPRAFSCVTGPVYLQRGYSKVMYAIEKSGLLPALKRANNDYIFFIESDFNTSQDSSFMYNFVDDRFSVFDIYEDGEYERFTLTDDDLRTLILNHVGTSNPTGLAKKEFIPNLAGNYLIFNNETGEVSGTDSTTHGYRGDIVMPNFPKPVNFEADNGTVYEIDNWFSFTSSTIYTKISTQFPRFHALLKKAGLSSDNFFEYTFISKNEFYTVFIPSEDALSRIDWDAMTVDELKNNLLVHFVKGEMIFTDGLKAPGYYVTERIDEISSGFSIINTKIWIEPGYDIIQFKGKEGGYVINVAESEKTNILTGILIDDVENVFPLMYNNAVIHEIDEVLNVETLATSNE